MKNRMALLGTMIARAAAAALIRWCDQYAGKTGKYSVLIEITPIRNGKESSNEANG